MSAMQSMRASSRRASLVGVHLIGVHLPGVHLSWVCISRGCAPHHTKHNILDNFLPDIATLKRVSDLESTLKSLSIYINVLTLGNSDRLYLS
jgi:hypothetical protein